MAERRQWTADEKAEIVAYSIKHGVKGAMEHFKVPATSMVTRWRRETELPTGRVLKWTPAKIRDVLEYAKTHTNSETLGHFKISSSQLHQWRHRLPGNHYSKKKANGAGPDVLNMDEKDALMWLERWRSAYFDRLKAETPLAAEVLAALRGGK